MTDVRPAPNFKGDDTLFKNYHARSDRQTHRSRVVGTGERGTFTLFLRPDDKDCPHSELLLCGTAERHLTGTECTIYNTGEEGR